MEDFWIESFNMETEMIRYCLMLNPENRKLSSEEIDRLVADEYKSLKE